MDWGYILEIVIKVLGSAAAALIIALGSILFNKLKSKIQDSKIMNYVKEAVKAAEQLYPNQGKKMGKEKYAYVVQQVLAKFPTLTDNEYLKSLIEGAVYTVSQQVKQIAKEQANSGTTSKAVVTTTNTTSTTGNNTTLSSF